MVCYSWFPLSLFLLLALRIREYDLLWAEAVEFVSKMTLIIPLALGILIYEVAIIQGFCVIPGVTAVMVNDLGFLWAGLDDQCGNDGVTEFTKALRDLSGAEGRCLYVILSHIWTWIMYFFVCSLQRLTFHEFLSALNAYVNRVCLWKLGPPHKRYF